MDSADFALRAYDEGRADGMAKRENDGRAADPGDRVWLAADPDYRVGLADGQLAAFEEDLIAAIRKAMDGKG